MKCMTCIELGGACDEVFTGETFEEVAQLSQKHGAQMASKNDLAHINAMNQMMELMNSGGFNEWFSGKKAIFEGR